MTYWRTVGGSFEVDCILGDQIALEIKGSEVFQDKMLAGLKALQEEKKIKRYFLISRDPVARKIDGIQVLYYQDFLNQLWDDQIIVDSDP